MRLSLVPPNMLMLALCADYCQGFVLLSARSSSPRRSLQQPRMEEAEVLPLFLPTAEVAFPFPTPEQEGVYRYTFDSASSARMLRSLDGAGALFGHCVCAADGASPATAAEGAVGVAVRLLSPGEDEFGGELVTADGVAAYRFVVRELVSTFPFATARVQRLCTPSGLEPSVSTLGLHL